MLEILDNLRVFEAFCWCWVSWHATGLHFGGFSLPNEFSSQHVCVCVCVCVTPWRRVLFDKTNSFAVDDEIHRILWNRKCHYGFQNSPPLVPVLSHLSPVRTSHPVFLRSIVILSSYLPLDLPSGLFASGCPSNPLLTCRFPPYG